MSKRGIKQTPKELVSRYAHEALGSNLDIQEPPPDDLFRQLSKKVDRIVLLPVEMLVIEDNVRKILDTNTPEFASLVDSIRSEGVRQSIIVDLQERGQSDFALVVLAGQRRVLAAREAGVVEIAALLLKTEGKAQRVAVGLTENILRQNLHPLDQAEGYLALSEGGLSNEEIANQFERGKKTIEQYLRLARFPESARWLIREHKDKFNSFVLFQRFVAKKWKSEEELLEALSSFVAMKKKRKETKSKSQDEKALVEAVNRHAGFRCSVKGTADSGEVVIKFGTRENFDFLLKLFGKGD